MAKSLTNSPIDMKLGRRLKEQIGYSSISGGMNLFRNASPSTLRFRASILSNKNQNIYHGLENILLQTSMNDDDRAEIEFENHAKRIISKMENDRDLMENTKESEKLRRETIRKMPQCLTIKRSINRKLTKTMNTKRGKKIGVLKTMQYNIATKYSHVKNYVKNAINNYEPWYDSLKTIEGHFGSGTSSYFKFLRSLFLMNIWMTLILLVFIVFPQITIDNIINAFKNMETFKISDIVTGEGFLENSLLFYGYYSNQTVNFYGINFNMPLAYFFTMAFVYFVSFMILSYSVAISYRRSFIESELGVKDLFAQKILCGWDFGIATKEASDLKSVSIYNELKELMSEINSKNEDVPLIQQIKILSIKVISNIFILLTLIGIGVSLWILLEMHEHNKISPVEIALVANIFNAILPLAFTKITSYETYNNPRNTVRITLIRSFLLSSVIVGTLVAFWVMHSFKQDCWETSLGQEIYRLILFDFLLSLSIHGIHLIIHWIKLYRYNEKKSYFEFDVAVNTLDLIYNQSLFWMGLFFSPLLALVVTVKIFLLRYSKEFFLLKLCKPSSKAWRASQTQTWILTLTFLTLLATTCLMVFIIIKIPPTNCGPFRGYKFIYEIIMTGVDPIFPFKYLSYLLKPGVVALIIIGLCVRVYYVRAKAKAQRDMVKLLRNLIAWGCKDKKFLIDYITDVTEGEWKFDKRDAYEDPYVAVPDVKPSDPDA